MKNMNKEKSKDRVEQESGKRLSAKLKKTDQDQHPTQM